MDDVTDIVFREVIAETARPDVFFTEFTNVDGLQSVGREKLLPRLKYTESERPIVAQIWGLQPKNYFEVAKQLKEMGFDGIDINMGCPQRNVIRSGSCSALIKNRNLAKEIIQATKEGAGSASRRIPVSVKTRLGYNSFITEDWIGFLLEQGLDAITVHGRIATQMSKYPANWEEIGKAAALRDEMGVDTKIFGNGDVLSMDEANQKVKEYGVDGVMIGRGIFHNPWVFEKQQREHTKEEKLDILLKHVDLFDKTWGNIKKFDTLKKYFKIYVNNFDGAAELRAKLMETKRVDEVKEIIKNLYILR
ncbi:MAG: tRNA-dihydrouridine synthase [Candidatus Daviesbacteria bacterium GW2011_GWA2_38_24]|uniref:tRNA-dihydrouridine synthase n=1 Tax=Candidatus Daviesbacteria bacterium GW2011_GWA2_38_24 TaxID=1618422 RepID=A0A0G0LX32_9BACT|nr:MAG: tRNA-dihydrouridine synthase [Candidatus Daviesbacteria bacterium GW2011_GWA2_38_24]KKQ80859.1 MAG: tRNA-dihydrouridine synthase [Candidatus Daviesbacteria bacterium GW2011_GWA1_38_7]